MSRVRTVVAEAFRLVETRAEGDKTKSKWGKQPPVSMPTLLRCRQHLQHMIGLRSIRIDIEEKQAKGWTPVLFWQIGGRGIQQVHSTTRKEVRHGKAKRK